MNTAAAALSATRDVGQNYVHADKFAQPGDTLVLSSTTLKWHNLAPAEKPVPAAIEQLARTFLERQDAAGQLSALGDTGFVILHRCGDSFYFLLASTWKNDNEIWETVYAKDAGDDDFSLFQQPKEHRGTFCVWELACVWHEQQAWRRFLVSARGADDRVHYINDTFTGAA